MTQKLDQRFARETTFVGRSVVARGGFRRQAEAGRRRVAKGEPEALRLAMHIVRRRGDQRIIGDPLGPKALPDQKPKPGDAGGPGGFFRMRRWFSACMISPRDEENLSGSFTFMSTVKIPGA